MYLECNEVRIDLLLAHLGLTLAGSRNGQTRPRAEISERNGARLILRSAGYLLCDLKRPCEALVCDHVVRQARKSKKRGEGAETRSGDSTRRDCSAQLEEGSVHGGGRKKESARL